MGSTKWPAIIIIVVLVLLAVILFLQQNPTTTDNEPLPTTPEEPLLTEHTIRISSQGFSPEEITVPFGEVVTLTLRSTDGLAHGFELPVYKISERIEANEEIELKFGATIQGRFVVYDSIASHSNNGNNKFYIEVKE